MLASVVSVAMTARYLGPGRYGQLTIAVVFIGMWTSFADLGISTVIVRRVTAGRGDLERLVRVNSGLSLMYCVPLAALAAGTGLLVYHDPDVRVMLVMLSGYLLMLTMTTCFEPVFLATVRFSAVAISDVASRLGTLAMVAWLVAVRGDVIWFAAAQLIPFALQLLIQGIAAGRQISVRPAFSLPEAADLLRETLPLAGIAVMAIVFWRADGVILSLVSTHSEVGVYGLAYTIAFNTVVVSTFFLKSTLSTATELFARDVTRIRRVYAPQRRADVLRCGARRGCGSAAGRTVDRVLRRPRFRHSRKAGVGACCSSQSDYGSSPPSSARVCSRATIRGSCSSCSSPR